MIRTKGRRRLTCHHEAGHALVRWYFGHRTDRAVVLTVEEVRAGKTIEGRRGEATEAEGAVIGWSIHMGRFGPTPLTYRNEELERRREVARDMCFIEGAAGAAAEAVYTRKQLQLVIIDGGLQDLGQSADIGDAWFPGDINARAAALKQAEKRALALVRSASGAAAIRAMADALHERGEIDGDEIGELCRAAYGGRECCFGAWDAHWPPTIAQLRAGFIPEEPPGRSLSPTGGGARVIA